ncbi:nucleoside/nucleotide kinase family protein [Vagococcus hydrophili]|uniref:Phosphoribulokinase/uridine kinase domain-containing protein n=1 Tax=Vagococcus hydrophili TaxID=2714947 RepID=A0A6G8AX14_9ENTE|nr:hypothetical protein [Vagococcus hydrophili]QIL49641.1 hypothetical protein G7082_14595 [Vagococcus hydrophili]
MYLIDIVANHLPNRKLKNNILMIGITGNVCSGKSTFASYLKKEINRVYPTERVQIISTDDFLYSNEELNEKHLFDKKGWVETYNEEKIAAFFSYLFQNKSVVLRGVYDQVVGDIINKNQQINNPSILIIEGTMALNSLFNSYIDFSLFLNVELNLNFKWYQQRTMKNISSKKEYAQIAPEKKDLLISSIWEEINMRAYYTYILPVKNQADMLVELDRNHEIKKIEYNKKIKIMEVAKKHFL